ncbi:helix-turn-helix domain-containing protein [Streptomyces sp. NPDC102437]|uniref:helix-turn-helix domain-containing protein n=1 Tax=Streptomyces sp. NPDC102437 TaxID=3366175 RepID=UPI0038265039
MSMSDGDNHLSRLGMKYKPRLKGEERTRAARSLAKKYDAGATIRGLAAGRGMSYGTVRKLLLEAKVELRKRGGRAPRAQAR